MKTTQSSLRKPYHQSSGHRQYLLVCRKLGEEGKSLTVSRQVISNFFLENYKA